MAGEAEAVASDDGAVLEDDVVAELAVLADDGVGVGEEVASNVSAGVDHDVRENGRVGADDDVVADDRVGADVGVGADFRGGCDYGRGMDSGGVGGRLVEEFERAGEGEVRVGYAEGGGRYLLECRVDQDYGGVGGAGAWRVFGIRYEGELAGPGVFEARG